MKSILLLFAFPLIVAVRAEAQQSPEYLKAPVSWEFERFALPPGFSAGFPYKGVEELRFSPGMFKKDSADYFSYAFVARLDNTPALTREDVQNYLLLYFKGLCASTAQQRKLMIDTNKITVSIEKAGNGSGEYNAILRVFGVFADGAPVTLNAEVKVLTGKDTTYLVFIASPQKKTHPIWQVLKDIKSRFSVPG